MALTPEDGTEKVDATERQIEQADEERSRLMRRVLLKLDTRQACSKRLLLLLLLLLLLSPVQLISLSLQGSPRPGTSLRSFLDRANVGNAKILGLETDLGLTNLQYSQGLAVFYVTYIVSELPSNLVLKKATHKVWLPFLAAAWGVLAMCLGFVHSYGSFMAVRALLGLAEGGLLPGMALYLSSLYTRSEVALRIGIFYTAASLSGAFGGLHALGLLAIGPRGGLEGWRWVMIIEGLLTAVAAGIACFVLPSSLAAAGYLTEDERAVAVSRLDGSAMSADGRRFNVALEGEERFCWAEVRRGLLNIQLWLTATAYFAILSGLYSFGLFLPTIVNNLHITSNANQTQLWTVIPYAVATPMTVIVALISDRARLRGVIMLLTIPIAIAGYAVIANVDSSRLRFAMTCLMAIGMYSSVPCVLGWNSNNSAGHYKRATTSALQLAIANVGGFVASKSGPCV